MKSFEESPDENYEVYIGDLIVPKSELEKVRMLLRDRETELNFWIQDLAQK